MVEVRWMRVIRMGVSGVLEEDGGVEMNGLHTHERSAARHW
jgi:hypothetical protein